MLKVTSLLVYIFISKLVCIVAYSCFIDLNEATPHSTALLQPLSRVRDDVIISVSVPAELIAQAGPCLLRAILGEHGSTSGRKLFWFLWHNRCHPDTLLRHTLHNGHSSTSAYNQKAS
jgi:hypothetical protein